MEVILPCAGASSRFPNMRPKYLLSDYANRMMIENAAKNYIGKHRVTIVILKEHDDKYNARKKLEEVFGHKADIIILEQPTEGPAHTVAQAIIRGRISANSPILVKDCDGFYDTQEVEGNVIYVAKLSKHPKIRTAAAKSYTITNDQGIINTVVEKQIVSNHFCVGGYQFESANEFYKAFQEIKKNTTSEIFVSNVIDYMISNGTMFFESEVENFIDVGVADDWFEFNNKPAYFCDIDGTIVKNSNDYETYRPLYDNIAKLKAELDRGCQITFCTARPWKQESVTRKMLQELGFTDYNLLMGIHHAKRILINDFASSNPYPSAIAINLVRDADNLGDMI